MKSALLVEVLIAVAALLVSMLAAHAVSDGPPDSLAPPESFAAIGDTAARSAALFTEAGMGTPLTGYDVHLIAAR